MKPKNCLIFGASGLVGRNLIRKLTENNFKVTAVTRNAHQKGYILKTSLDDIGELIRVVEAVANGGTVLDPELVQKLVRLMVSKETPGISDLNATEREVYELLVGGYEDAEIARTLRLTQDDVKEVTSSATSKLGIPDAGELDKRSQAVEHFINRFTQVLYESEPD